MLQFFPSVVNNFRSTKFDKLIYKFYMNFFIVLEHNKNIRFILVEIRANVDRFGLYLFEQRCIIVRILGL